MTPSPILPKFFTGNAFSNGWESLARNMRDSAAAYTSNAENATTPNLPLKHKNGDQCISSGNMFG